MNYIDMAMEEYKKAEDILLAAASEGISETTAMEEGMFDNYMDAIVGAKYAFMLRPWDQFFAEYYYEKVKELREYVEWMVKRHSTI